MGLVVVVAKWSVVDALVAQLSHGIHPPLVLEATVSVGLEGVEGSRLLLHSFGSGALGGCELNIIMLPPLPRR